jgi:tRNA threonylcarbamoyladenosine biosynthesis protein TsaB
MTNDADAGPLILAVETATRAGSVSLAAGRRILYSLTGDSAASHSTNLIENIDELLRAANLRLNDVDLFAAAVGPGSFTGLRIGLATIKGFAACLDRKCAGVSTLAAIALVAGTSGRTVAMLPAGRGEVFAQLFSVGAERELEPIDSAVHLNPNSVMEKYGSLRQLTWAGEGSQVHAAALRAWAEQKAIDVVEGDANSDVLPSGLKDQWTLAAPCGKVSESVAALALREYEHGRLISAEELQAVYVRPSDAETNRQWQEAKPTSTLRR